MVWAAYFGTVTALELARHRALERTQCCADLAVVGAPDRSSARGELTEVDIADIVSAEKAGRRSAANDYDRLGGNEQSARLREADVLATMLDGG